MSNVAIVSIFITAPSQIVSVRGLKLDFTIFLLHLMQIQGQTDQNMVNLQPLLVQ